jgi:hypothetical protein
MGRKGSARKRRVALKLAKAATAGSTKGRINYLVDVVFDEAIPNAILDEAAHFAVEVGLGRGPLEKRVAEWGGKALKFRMKSRKKRKNSSSREGRT